MAALGVTVKYTRLFGTILFDEFFTVTLSEKAAPSTIAGDAAASGLPTAGATRIDDTVVTTVKGQAIVSGDCPFVFNVSRDEIGIMRSPTEMPRKIARLFAAKSWTLIN